MRKRIFSFVLLPLLATLTACPGGGPDWAEGEKTTMIEQLGEVLPFIEIDGTYTVSSEDGILLIESDDLTQTTAEEYASVLIDAGYQQLGGDASSPDFQVTIFAFAKASDIDATKFISVEVMSGDLATGLSTTDNYFSVAAQLINIDLLEHFPNEFLAQLPSEVTVNDFPSLTFGEDYAGFMLPIYQENYAFLDVFGVSLETYEEFCAALPEQGYYHYLSYGDYYVAQKIGGLAADLIVSLEYDATYEAMYITVFVQAPTVYLNNGWPSADLARYFPLVDFPVYETEAPINAYDWMGSMNMYAIGIHEVDAEKYTTFCGLYLDAGWVEDENAIDEGQTLIDASGTTQVNILYDAARFTINLTISEYYPALGWEEALDTLERVKGLDLSAIPEPQSRDITSITFDPAAGGAILIQGDFSEFEDEYTDALVANGFEPYQMPGYFIYNSPGYEYAVDILVMGDIMSITIVAAQIPVNWTNTLWGMNKFFAAELDLPEPEGWEDITYEGDAFAARIEISGLENSALTTYQESLLAAGLTLSGTSSAGNNVYFEANEAYYVEVYFDQDTMIIFLFIDADWQKLVAVIGDDVGIADLVLPEPVDNEGFELFHDITSGGIIVEGYTQDDVNAYQGALLASGYSSHHADAYGDQVYQSPNSSFFVSVFISDSGEFCIIYYLEIDWAQLMEDISERLGVSVDLPKIAGISVFTSHVSNQVYEIYDILDYGSEFVTVYEDMLIDLGFTLIGTGDYGGNRIFADPSNTYSVSVYYLQSADFCLDVIVLN